MAEENSLNAVELATELTIAWLSNQNNRFSADEVPEFLRKMHATVTELADGAPATSGEDAPAEEPVYTPAVTVRKSLASPDHIISMIDGKPYKTLRRHLSTHGLTPDQYRERYGLKNDYPMVARNYSEARRAMAHKIGLGAKGRQAKAAAGSQPTNAEEHAAAAETKSRARRVSKSVNTAESTPAATPKRRTRSRAEQA